jgi:hypothetical protein
MRSEMRKTEWRKLGELSDLELEAVSGTGVLSYARGLKRYCFDWKLLACRWRIKGPPWNRRLSWIVSGGWLVQLRTSPAV